MRFSHNKLTNQVLIVYLSIYCVNVLSVNLSNGEVYPTGNKEEI